MGCSVVERAGVLLPSCGVVLRRSNRRLRVGENLAFANPRKNELAGQGKDDSGRENLHPHITDEGNHQ